MKRFLLAAALLLALPVAAHATPVHPGMRIQPVRSQIVDAAKAAGFLGKGTGEKLVMRTTTKPSMGTPGEAVVKITGTGGFTGQQKGVTIATAKFKIAQEVEGRIAAGETNNGVVFQRIAY